MLNLTQPVQAKSHRQSNLLIWWLGILFVFMLSGCKPGLEEDLSTSTEQPSATITRVLDQAFTVTPKPTRLLSSTLNPTLQFSLEEAAKVAIFSDGFNPNWMILGAQDEEINLLAKNQVYNGLFSIAITPKKAESQLFMIVRDSTDEVYPRRQVLGFQLRLNPGSHPLTLSDLVVGVLGSNTKAELPDPENLAALAAQPIFDQVDLYAPGADPVFPTNTWTEVVIWLEDSSEAFEFEYLTGLSIQRSDAFQKTFFLDDIQLIISGSQPLPTQDPPTATASHTPYYSPTPTETATPTQTRTPLTPRYSPTPTRTEKPGRTKAPAPPPDTAEPTLPPTPPPVEP